MSSKPNPVLLQSALGYLDLITSNEIDDTSIKVEAKDRKIHSEILARISRFSGISRTVFASCLGEYIEPESPTSSEKGAIHQLTYHCLAPMTPEGVVGHTNISIHRILSNLVELNAELASLRLQLNAAASTNLRNNNRKFSNDISTYHVCVAEVLQSIALLYGLTQAQLAAEIHCGQGTVSNFLRRQNLIRERHIADAHTWMVSLINPPDETMSILQALESHPERLDERRKSILKEFATNPGNSIENLVAGNLDEAGQEAIQRLRSKSGKERKKTLSKN